MSQSVFADFTCHFEPDEILFSAGEPGTTLFVVLAQFAVNYGSGSALEGFSFALILGILTGTYSTMFIAAPLVLRLHDGGDSSDPAALQTSSAPLPPDGSVQGVHPPCEPLSTSRLPNP